MHPSRYLPRTLPASLAGLADLAVDLRWSWNHSADVLWQTVDPELWAGTGDPWLILESVSRERLEALAEDTEFVAQLRQQLDARKDYLAAPTWFSNTHKDDALSGVAYFSMEFGLSESLPIYSGGLGILAGDHLKTGSDLGVPLVGIGLLYQQGYFHQAVDANGDQLEFFPYNNPAMLPVMPLRDAGGEWLRVSVDLPGRRLYLRGWQAQVGRITLYLLDSNDLLNSPGDRGITGELYGGGSELRLQQEIVLGIGGWRLLQGVGLDCQVCHLNEGHAAFAVLERARSLMRNLDQDFHVTLTASRAGNLFTTHTPVEAGFDRFAPALFSQYFQAYAATLGIPMQDLLALGRADTDDPEEPFNMAYLALRGSGRVNGVSRLHGAVSRHIFQPLFPHWPQVEVPVGHVTNGIHVPSWDSAAADALWTEACGKDRWLGEMESLEQNLRSITDRELWTFRSRGRSALVDSVRRRLQRQSAAHGATPGRVAACSEFLDPNTLTLGFARRFAAYKRPNLLLHDPERLLRLLRNAERPVQLVIAGKAHPRDQEGKRMIHQWAEFVTHSGLGDRVVFLEDYDMALAAELVQGVDVWINTPRRPWEASGTSGMKVLVNGGLNLSELDGWWAEAYEPSVGWALGDGHEHPEPEWDGREARALYDLLEQTVVPTFYDRDEKGIPVQWVHRMRESMAQLTPRFSTNRMMREYVEHYYLPAAGAYRARSAEQGALAVELTRWDEQLRQHWPKLRFGGINVQRAENSWRFEIQAYLDELDADSVCIELYADPADDSAPLRLPMTRGEPLTGAVNAFTYHAEAPADRPAAHYTPRIVAYHPDALVPTENNRILWIR